MSRIERIAALFAAGRPEEAAREAVELGLDLVPADILKGYLTDAAAARAEKIADVAEDAKFGPRT